MAPKFVCRLCIIFAVAQFNSNLLASTDAELADSYFQAQQWPQAAQSYQDLTKLENATGQYWFRLGRSLYQLQQYPDAIAALQQAIALQDQNAPLPNSLLFLARSQAANGDKDEAIDSISAIQATGARPFQAVKNSTEFYSFSNEPTFLTALNNLKPCNSPEHRAFDFWLGEWTVTSPTRQGWTAQSSITTSNDDCSVHENYQSQGGYAGKSINFYDPQKQKWHQTWIDNRGAPIYLEGNLENDAMILADETNRVTWSVQTDQRVRQHWETTTDGGETWSTAFDGYYSKQ